MKPVRHEWYNQNEDHKEINDRSEVEFVRDEDGVTGTLTVTCNETEREYEFTGVPTLPSPEELGKLEKWPVDPDDDEFVEELVKLFGVRLID